MLQKRLPVIHSLSLCCRSLCGGSSFVEKKGEANDSDVILLFSNRVGRRKSFPNALLVLLPLFCSKRACFPRAAGRMNCREESKQMVVEDNGS